MDHFHEGLLLPLKKVCTSPLINEVQYIRHCSTQFLIRFQGWILVHSIQGFVSTHPSYYIIYFKKNNMQQIIQLKILRSFSLLMFSLLCLCAGTNAYSQTGTIKGKVINESGAPVPGATVAIKGTNNGTTTNDKGDFIIAPANKDASLIISSIGYEKQELFLDGRTNLVITLKSKPSELDQAIVIAYGTTTKRLNTGDVSKVTAEEIERQPVSNPLAALEGRVPGLIVTQNTGVPGGSFNIQIRGKNSIANGNDPLYIIDGVPFTSISLSSIYTGSVINLGNPLSNINPADIESIEVLKDADATSIYGSRGANGVILITTKKAKPGKIRFEFNAYTGTGKVTRMLKLLNTPQYLAMRHEAFSNDGARIGPTNYDINGTWDTTRYTDWQKLLIGGTANIIDMQGSISGGNSNTQFLMSSGYHQESTVFPGNFSDQKVSSRFYLTHSSSDQRFKATFSAFYNLEFNNLLTEDLTHRALTLAPDAPPIYDSSGKLNWPHGFDNPFSVLNREYKAYSNNLISNMDLSYQVCPSLQLKSSFGYTNMTMDEKQTVPLSSINPAYAQTGGSAIFSNSGIKTWIIEPQVNWSRKINKVNINILVGGTFQEDIRNGQSFYGRNFSSDALLENIAAASTITVLSADNTQYHYQALYGRINANWQQKYIVNITGRRDGSSRFGPGRQYGDFGAIGAAWIFSKETKVQNLLPFLSFGKLRASYGTTGNDQIGDYEYLNTYSTTNYPYQGISGLIATRLFNPNYGWEVNRKLEGAIELGFLKERVFFNAAYYMNRSSNQLVGYPLPGLTGFSSVQANSSALVQNSGWEMNIASENIKNDNFRWSTSLNISFPSNKLVAYPGLANSNYANTYVIGKPLSTKKLFHFTGVNTQTGVYTFEDVDKDGTISYPEDLVPSKQVAQSFYGGIQNSLQYKNWELVIFVQFVKQTGFNYLYNYSNNYLAPGMLGNQPAIVLSRWKKPGDISDIQRFTQNYGSSAFAAFIMLNDDMISDASFLRLKNISISYHLPHKLIQNIYLPEGKLYIQCQNLLTVTKYLGMDPENQSINNLPPLKMVTAGIQVTF